jgi:putative phosphoesterase
MRASRSAAGTRNRAPARRAFTVGVISDTHGLLRPEALTALRGVDAIVHAGDVGARDVLDRLAAIAPVTAVRGNNDREAWARALPEAATLELGGARLYVLHDRAELHLDPEQAGFAAVITGHSHRPSLERRGTVLFLNPGSAGPRRFTLPVSTARLRVANGKVRARLVPLAV